MVEDKYLEVDSRDTYPLVSVIMPCYNDGSYIEEAVESVSHQTYPNMELIIIDDGSDDGFTPEKIKNINFQNKIVISTNHIGPAAARNTGIKRAKGKYILPLDADDTISEQYIEKAVFVMENNDKIGIVYCHASLFGEEQGDWNIPSYSLDNILIGNCIFVTSLFRKKDWETIGGFSDSFTNGLEDYDFWLSLIENGKEVHQLPETLFHYRIKKKSRSTRFNMSLDDMQQTYEMLFQRHRKLYEENMDSYCTMLRRNQIENIWAHNVSCRTNNDEMENWWKDFAGKHARCAAILSNIILNMSK